MKPEEIAYTYAAGGCPEPDCAYSEAVLRAADRIMVAQLREEAQSRAATAGQNGLSSDYVEELLIGARVLIALAARIEGAPDGS